MSANCLLLALALAPAAPPDRSAALLGPQLARGEEYHYRGTIREVAERPEGRWIKSSRIEVRLYVLEASAEFTDVAVLTSILPLDDERVASAIKTVSGQAAERAKKAALRLDLVRLSDRGRASLLRPKATVRPLVFDADTPTADVPSIPLEEPNAAEFGMILPLPLTHVKLGDSWDSADGTRPPIRWNAADEGLWNGRRCLEIRGVQQSEGYETPKAVRAGWQRSETMLISPVEGIASTIKRTIARRSGPDLVGSVEVEYELQPSKKHIGAGEREHRAEIEAAWAFEAESAELLQGKQQPVALRTLKRDLETHLETNGSTSFRPMIRAILHKLEPGSAPPVAPVPKLFVSYGDDSLPKLGRPAPDFIADNIDKPTETLRLGKLERRPKLLAFYKPGSATSKETLIVVEALYTKFGTKVDIVPLACAAELVEASKQRSSMKLTVPIFDGREVKRTYGVSSYPYFAAIDATGALHWTFDAGIGPEVGFLIARELEALLKQTSK